MRWHWTRTRLQAETGAAMRAAVTAGLLLASAALAAAQGTAPPSSPAPQSPPSQPSPPQQSAPSRPPNGLFEAIGRWIDQGAADVRDRLRGDKAATERGNIAAEVGKNATEVGKTAVEVTKNAAEVGKTAVEATRNAVDTVVRLPVGRQMSGHERCAVAPNGAPDCIAAAEALCRKHGYTTGKSTDFTSAEECPARTWLSGRRSGSECTTVTVISRAMCQ